jgi:DegV family protein with EDD domain
MSIIVTADSSCDLPIQFLEPIPFAIFPLTIIQNGIEYKDGLEITPEEIYLRVDQGEPVPTTSAVNVIDYHKRFEKLSHQYDAVIHVSLGSAISSCYSHAQLAAKDFPNVYIIDSKNISLGHGLLVLEARRLILEEKSPPEIVSYLSALADKIEFTFLLDQVTYLHKGGRCSNIAALGANLLKLKPVIAVQDGKLTMVRKYRGSFEKVMPYFFQDQLMDRSDIQPEKTMLITTRCPSHWITLASSEIALYTGYQVNDLFYAGCTICSHSGPKALGLAVLKK